MFVEKSISSMNVAKLVKLPETNGMSTLKRNHLWHKPLQLQLPGQPRRPIQHSLAPNTVQVTVLLHQNLIYHLGIQLPHKQITGVSGWEHKSRMSKTNAIRPAATNVIALDTVESNAKY